MNLKSEFETRGVCARKIELDVEDGVIKSINFIGGCDGNLRGISRLLVGMRAKDAIERLEGIRCGRKDTSCPDQLAKALGEMKETGSVKQ